MRRLLAASAITLVSTACAVPIQDNPNDPKNRPIPAVLVQVQTGQVTEDDDGFVSASSAKRGTMFRFDASGTVGPRGKTLTFRWDFDDDPTTFEFPPATASSNSAMVAYVVPEIYPSDLVDADGVGIALRTVRLRVEAGGAEAELDIRIALSNDAPIIDPGEDLVVPAVSQHLVTLDACGGRTTLCTTTDPDGEIPGDFHWTQVGTPTVTLSTDGEGRAFFVPPATPERLVFRLQGSDGLSTRYKDQVVRVGARAWARTKDRLYVLDGESRSRAFPSPTFSFEEVAVSPSGDIWLAGSTGTGFVAVRRYHRDGMVQLGAWLVPGISLESLVPDVASAIIGNDEGFSELTGTSTVTAVFQNGEEARDSAPGGWFLTDTALYRDTGGIAPDKITNIPGVGQFPEFLRAFLAFDLEGTPWVASQSSVFRLQGNSLILKYQAPVGFILGLSTHPDGGILEIHADDQTLDLGIITAGSPRQRVATIPYPASVVTLASDPTRRTVWVYAAPKLFRVESPFGSAEPVVTIDLESDVESDLGVGLDETLNVYSIAADVRHGMLAVSGTSTSSVNVDTGYLAILPASLKRTAQVPGATPIDSAQNPSRISIDPTRGDAWYEGLITGVTRITSSGRLLATDVFEDRFVVGPFATPDGGAVGAYLVDQFTGVGSGVVAVSSTGAWLSQSGFTERFALSRVSAGNELGICAVADTSVMVLDPVSGAPVRVDPIAGTSVEYSYPPFDRGHVDAAAVSTDGSTCWFAINIPNRMLTVSGTSTVVESGVLAAQAVALAADPRTGGGVWRADSAGFIARFAGGAGSFTATETPVTALAVERVCDTPTDPACIRIWYAAPGVVVLSRPDGTVIQKFPVQGEVTELSVPR